MINFSNTCGIGLNGARSIKIATTIRIEYGILSRNVHMVILVERYKIKNWAVLSHLRHNLSRK
jgi:hypothetical protein